MSRDAQSFYFLNWKMRRDFVVQGHSTFRMSSEAGAGFIVSRAVPLGASSLGIRWKCTEGRDKQKAHHAS